nr:hypothetical protein [Tanacetum cinerariifolium]
HGSIQLTKKKGYEDNDRSIDIEETDDERMKSDSDDQVMIDAPKHDTNKIEEEQGDEEQAKEDQDDDDDQDQEDQVDDDIIGTLVTMSQKEKAEVPRSSSSRSLSLNYGNEFLNLSSDASLVDVSFELGKSISKTDAKFFDEIRAGVIPEVPDEPTTSSVAKDKHDIMIDWGSKEESDKSDANIDDIPWVDTADKEKRL